MRILLANQGWASSMATAFAASHPWPSDTVFRVVTVVDPAGANLRSFPNPGRVLEDARRRHRHAETTHEGAIHRLAKRGFAVDGQIVYGPPARTLAASARDFEADLLIVGPWERTLGDPDAYAVAGDLVDSALCPVLVVRRSAVRRVLVATDGSDAASNAVRFVAESGAFANAPVAVVSVAESSTLPGDGVVAKLASIDEADLAERRARHRGFATAAGSRLAAAGHPTTVDVRTGDVTAGIRAAAEASKADLVVLGSDHVRGLSRIIVGSVGRQVLAAISGSLLVVPESDRLRLTLGPAAGRAAASAPPTGLAPLPVPSPRVPADESRRMPSGI